MNIPHQSRMLKSKWYMLIPLSAILISLFLIYEYNSDRKQAIANAKRQLILEDFNNKKEAIRDFFRDIYVNTRTISLLPGVRSIKGGNRLSVDEDVVARGRFSAEAHRTIQQIYNNLSTIGASEIYAVVDGFNPKKGEVPFFMYDSLVIEGGVASEDEVELLPADFPEEKEDEEYDYYVKQLDYFRDKFPVFNVVDLENIPIVSSDPVRTCDNTQYLSIAHGDPVNTRGLLYSLPFYSAGGDFRGIISTVFRLNVLEALLLDVPFLIITERDKARAKKIGFEMPGKTGDFVLVNESRHIFVGDRRDPDLIQQVKKIESVNRNGFYMEKLNIKDDTPWTLYFRYDQEALDSAVAGKGKVFFLSLTIVVVSAILLMVGAFAYERIKDNLRELEEAYEKNGEYRTKSSFKIKKLTRAYILSLLLIVFLLICGHIINQQTISKHEADALIINLAGRQRMLSQKITKEVLLLAYSKNIEVKKINLQKLKIITDQFHRVHNGLLHGDKELSLPASNSFEIIKYFKQIETYHQNIVSSVNGIIELDTDNLKQLSSTSPLVIEIVDSSSLFLELMDKIVFQYQKEADEKLSLFKQYEIIILLIIIFIILLEGFLIFHPLMRQVKNSYEQLEKYANEMEYLAEERAKQLVHADRMVTIGTLSAGVAHEIGNPVAFIGSNLQIFERLWNRSIKVCVEKAKDENGDKNLSFALDEMPKMVKAMREGVNRISTIVRNLCDFSRVEEATFGEASISECINNAVTFCMFDTSMKHGVDVQINISQSIPNIVMNKSEMEQVFINIFTNAVHAMKKTKDDRKPTLKISAVRADNEVAIEVSDNGCGIDEKNLKNIFNPFFTTKEAGKSTGLGLSICFGIVEKKHRGTINAASRQGEGTTFTITLPLDPTKKERREGDKKTTGGIRKEDESV